MSLQGHSSCNLVYTVVLAIQRFAAAIDARVDIEWVPRCSDTGSLIADQLSKGLFSLARREAGTDNPTVGRYSSTLAAYSMNPAETRVLGQAMAMEASAFMTTLPTSVEKSAEVEEVYKQYRSVE